jgi:hypothetical protein
MASIANVYKRIKAVDIEDVARKSIEDTKDAMADYNAQQLYQGLRSDGDEINPQYSETTIAIKKEKGQVTDRVTLKDTGAFYAGLRVVVSGNNVTIDSTDEKSEKLFDKYSTQRSNIFGLNPQFKREYLNEVLQPEWRRNVHNATGL